MKLAGKYSQEMSALAAQFSPSKDPRDYFIFEDGLWRSQLLPLGITIDQAIKDGTW
jgi:hypothetical protein